MRMRVRMESISGHGGETAAAATAATREVLHAAQSMARRLGILEADYPGSHSSGAGPLKGKPVFPSPEIADQVELN